MFLGRKHAKMKSKSLDDPFGTTFPFVFLRRPFVLGDDFNFDLGTSSYPLASKAHMICVSVSLLLICDKLSGY
jgi:hypothetical protein